MPIFVPDPNLVSAADEGARYLGYLAHHDWDCQRRVPGGISVEEHLELMRCLSAMTTIVDVGPSRTCAREEGGEGVS